MDEIEIINVMVFLREIALVGSTHIRDQSSNATWPEMVDMYYVWLAVYGVR